MQSSPITDKSLGIIVDHDHKFSDIKARAKDEEEKIRKTKHNKQEPTPKYSIGDNLVVATGGIGSKSRHYLMIEVIDFDHSWNDYHYFGVVKKVTDPKQESKLGRLVKVNERTGYFEGQVIGQSEQGIRWIKEIE